MFPNMPGNYWLNMILFENLLDELYVTYRPMMSLLYKSEQDLKSAIYATLDLFLFDKLNEKYLKFHNYLKYKFTFVIISGDLGKYGHLGEYCKIDTIYFGT